MKDRIAMMVDVMKNQYSVMIEKWLEEIDASPEKKTVIDIAVVFEELLAQNILTISFGEDISQTEVEVYMRNEDFGSDFTLELKTVKVGKAITEAIDLVIIGSGFKGMNPLYKKARKLTGIKNFTEFQR
jgi:hypothetical protein